jgi:hypothetical protein
VEVHDTWEATTQLAEFIPKIPPTRIQLTLKVVTASVDYVRVQLVTTMRMRYEGNWDRLGFDLLEMTDSADTAFIGWLAGREQTTVEEVAHFLEQSVQESQAVLNDLVQQGVLLEATEQGRTFYCVHFAAKRQRKALTSIWQALDDSAEMAGRSHDTVRLAKKGILLRGTKELVQGDSGRFWLGLFPLILIFLVCEWLLVKRLESFAQMLAFLGIAALPVEIGIFPVLLLYASRRKGEYVPGFVLRFLAHPVIVGTIYLVAVGILFLHGLFIWQDPFQRVLALLVGIAILGATILMMRQGAFARRVVIEVRQDGGGKEQENGTFAVTNCGQAATQVAVWLGYANSERSYEAACGSIPAFEDLYSARFFIPMTQAQELMVWVHRVTPQGRSENLPALVKVSSRKQTREVQMDGVRQQLVLPLPRRANGKQVGKETADEPDQIEVEVQLATAAPREK